MYLGAGLKNLFKVEFGLVGVTSYDTIQNYKFLSTYHVI